MRTSILNLRSCAVLACLTAMPATGALAGLLHYQPFDDAGAASLVNKGSAGGTSTVVNVFGQTTTDTTDTPSGLPGYAHSFPTTPGVNFGGRVDLSNSSTTLGLDTSTQAMSVSLWLKWDGAPTADAQGLITKLNGGGNAGWALVVTGDGKLRFNWTEQGPNPYGGNRFSTTSLVPGAWTHVGMTWSSSQGEGLKFFLNGEDAGISLAYTGAPLMNLNTADAIRIGNLDGTYLPLHGTVDEVGIWNNQLTAAEIRSLDKAPAVLSGYSADKLQSLFALYDAASPTGTQTIGGVQWAYASNLTGHSAGDVWQVGSQYFIQLDAFGTGVAGSAVPEPAALGAIASAALLLRRRRA